jgi:hypothetical protein
MFGTHRNLSEPLKPIKEIEAIKWDWCPSASPTLLYTQSLATQLTSGWAEDITL